MLVSDVLVRLHEQFTEAGIEDPAADAELIVGHVIGESRGRVQALSLLGSSLTEEQAARIDRMAEDRSSRVPLQHLTGKAPFRSIELDVGPGVFIPRPETETVTQFAIDELHADLMPEPIVIDLCTGSGAIALAIAAEVDRARVWAIEKDESAHAWAERNVARLGDGRVTLLKGDVAELNVQDPDASSENTLMNRALAAHIGSVSVIVTNPPYVPEAAIPKDPEVRDHDPETALYSGGDGLDLIRVMSRRAKPLLKPGGLFVIEHAEPQGAAIRAILESDGWTSTSTHRDLTHRDRVTIARA